jgi:heat shock protein HtpX
MLRLAYGLAGGGTTPGGWGVPSQPNAHPARRRRKDLHLNQSAQLVGGMIALLGLCGMSLTQAGGLGGWLRRAGADPRDAAPTALLHALGARRIGPLDPSPAYALLEAISRRAGLPWTPDLYCIPAPIPNAFALGGPDHATVAVTDGLLRHLTLDELAGILAHEVAHIRNRDNATMALAHGLTAATELLALLGTTRRGGADAGLLLYLAPVISRLLQLALSRLRELDADLDAVELSGSPFGLMRALEKLDRHHAGARAVEPTALLGAVDQLLRSHPETPARVRSLLEVG